MRKTILKITLGGALAVTAAMGVQMASSNKTASNLFMQNVEALASGESGSNYNICYSQSKVMVGRTYYDCGTCAKVYDEKGVGNPSKCFY